MRTIHILMVDDDTADQMELRRALDRKNIFYQLKTARSSNDALAALTEASGRPDIILLDLNTPGINGLELIRHIRDHDQWKDIKIFALGPAGDHADKSTVLNLGASGFIAKPLKLGNLSSPDAFNLMIDLMNLQVE